MSKKVLRTGAPLRPSLCALGLLAALAFPAWAAGNGPDTYVQRNLVSDGSIPADHTDPHLIAPWGIASSPAGVLWVAANGYSASTIYDWLGNILYSP
ncbi:MAG: hypothetical protein ACM31P_03815, partial [Actinomycetota bacterium]